MTTKTAGIKALAMLAGGSLALSACATSNSEGDSSATSSGSAASAASTSASAAADTSFTWGYEQEFYSYNGNSEDGNASSNAVVLNGVLGGFWQFKPDGTLLALTDFGTYEKTSDSPLTVKYTINDKAVWSDGDPVDCDDMVLAWLSASGTTGEKGFKPSSTAGYEDMNAPACKAGDKSVTVTYKKVFADWAAMFGVGSMLPAHIVAKQGGLTKSFAEYAATPTSPDLAKAIEFWNAGWQLNPGELKMDIMPSSGPYMFDTWTAGQSITLKANDKYWGTAPKSAKIVIRNIAGTSQPQALQNGEINAMNPQPQVDLAKQLVALGDEINYSTGDQYTFEHYDFNFKGAFKDKKLREAFAKCLPRQQIVDNLVKPINPDAKILKSRFIFPFQPTYAAAIAGSPGDAYEKVDIAGAKALVGAKKIDVRVGWRKDPEVNKRRADTLALVKASCDQAGFNVIDAGTPTFFQKELPAGNYDVAMFAWAGSPLVTGSNDIYSTGGGNNFGKYSNAKVDELIKQLSAEIDPAKQVTIQKQIDDQLWTDLATIPLFAFAAVLATSKNAQGVEYNATQADLTWNLQDWSLS